MTHTTGAFRTTDGVKLFTQAWLPSGEPKAGIFLVHGLAEHSGRYAHVAEYLMARGFAVYAMDLRGHGQSEGLRSYIVDFRIWLEDLYVYFQSLRVNAPGLPWFVLGHSMGAALSLAFTHRHQDDLAGVVVSATALSIGETVLPLLRQMARVLSVMTPRLPVMAIPAGTISKDPAVRAAYDADPLNYRGRIRARMGHQLLVIADDVRAGAGRITIPALLMHGGADPLVDPGSLDEAYNLLASTDKTKKLYDGLYHEIFNEVEKEQVLADVAAWLEARV